MDHGLRALTLALTSAAAVGAALLVPTVVVQAALRPTDQAPRTATGVLPDSAPGARDWRATRCEDCLTPSTLSLHGRTLDLGRGVSQQVRRRDVTSRTLRWTARPASGLERWVLVGATGTSSASDLAVQVGDAPPVEVAFDRRTLLKLPASTSPVEVVLIERGQVSAQEVLTVREYAER